LSSWYVWASLGLFPIAGQSLYLINAPSFAQSRIAFADDDLLIDAPGFVEPVAGGPVLYVQQATFNGERLNRTWLTARELHRGGHLQLQLGASPSAWGTTTRPPSASQPHAMHLPAAAGVTAPANITDRHR
jgi:putative alpha-1,2-mannosidase